MSIFAGIEHKAGASGRDADITPGLYTFEVQSMADGLTPFTKEEFFEVKVKVIESAGEPSKTKDGQDVVPLAVGTDTKVFITKDKFGYYITDIKNVVSAISTSLLGEQFAPGAVTEDEIKTLVSTEQPAKGVRFKAQYVAKPGKFRKSGVPACGMKFDGIIGAAAKAA